MSKGYLADTGGGKTLFARSSDSIYNCGPNRITKYSVRFDDGTAIATARPFEEASSLYPMYRITDPGYSHPLDVAYWEYGRNLKFNLLAYPDLRLQKNINIHINQTISFIMSLVEKENDTVFMFLKNIIREGWIRDKKDLSINDLKDALHRLKNSEDADGKKVNTIEIFLSRLETYELLLDPYGISKFDEFFYNKPDIIINISQVNSVTRDVLAPLIVDMMLSFVYRDKPRTKPYMWVFFDEVGTLFATKETKLKLKDLHKRGRKYGVVPEWATQRYLEDITPDQRNNTGIIFVSNSLGHEDLDSVLAHVKIADKDEKNELIRQFKALYGYQFIAFSPLGIIKPCIIQALPPRMGLLPPEDPTEAEILEEELIAKTPLPKYEKEMNHQNHDENNQIVPISSNLPTIKCGKCGTENTNAKFCEYCGATLETPKIEELLNLLENTNTQEPQPQPHSEQKSETELSQEAKDLIKIADWFGYYYFDKEELKRLNINSYRKFTNNCDPNHDDYNKQPQFCTSIMYDRNYLNKIKQQCDEFIVQEFKNHYTEDQPQEMLNTHKIEELLRDGKFITKTDISSFILSKYLPMIDNTLVH